MKVLLINPAFYVYGGAERLIVKLCNHLTEEGVSTTLLTPNIPPRISEKLTETRIIRTGDIQNAAPTVQSIIHKFDVVNPHNDPAQLLVYPRKRPCVWMCNEPPAQILMGGILDEGSRRAVRNHVDISVVADEFNKKRFMDIYGVEPRVNHYGVDWQYFSEGNPDRVKEKLGIGEGFTVLQVGMHTFTKNQLRTVKEFKEIKKKIPDAQLVLAGYNETPYYEEVKKRITTSRLRKSITVTGELPQDDIRDLYYAADALIAPIMPQGGWLSTFEAMATGLPVVVSPDMTASSIISEHGLGTVTEDYTEAIAKIADNPQRSIKTRQWVKDNLNWETFCNNMLGYFEEVAP